jgi:hypothetical protein
MAYLEDRFGAAPADPEMRMGRTEFAASIRRAARRLGHEAGQVTAPAHHGRSGEERGGGRSVCRTNSASESGSRNPIPVAVRHSSS